MCYLLKGKQQFLGYNIYQMFRNQDNSTQQQLTQALPFNWLSFQQIQPVNYLAQPFYIPVSQITESDFNRSVCYMWVVPCTSQDNSREDQQRHHNIPNDDSQLSKQVKNISHNFQLQVHEIKNADKKRRKIIELQNIKQNERNRNILSNCLKLAIKSIRNTLQQQKGYFEKIVTTLKLGYSLQEFLQKLNQLLPSDINYIRPTMLKEIFEVQQQSFTIVLKILIKKFFKQEIYTSTGKNTPMKKLIKAQHIKAGRRLLEYLFGEKIPSQSREKI